MSPTSRVSGQPVALTSGTLVTSQSGENVVVQSGLGVVVQSGIFVNIGSGIGIVQASGAYIINDSGVRVVIQSGAPVSLQSGINVNIGSGIGMVQASGAFIINDSGVRVVIQSGAQIYLQSGSPVTVGLVSLSGINIASDGHIGVNIDTVDSSGLRVIIQSGAQVSIQSGTYVNVGSGLGVITSVSGQFMAISGTVALLSGGYVNIGSGVGVITSISGQAVFVSGTVNILSGAYVNVGSGIGVLVNTASLSGLILNAISGIGYTIGGINRAIFSGVSPVIASGQYTILNVDTDGTLLVDIDKTDSSGLGVMTSVSGNAVFVSGTVALLSGGFINVGSGIGVIIDNKLQSGQYIIMSGQGVSIASGIAYQMSGANVIATVTVGSGLGVLATTSGQGFPAIGGINRAITSGGQTVLASGVIAIPSLDVNGNLVVMTSGQTANMISGQALYVQESGVNAVVSGRFILSMPLGAAAVTASTFIVNTSAVQLPNTAGREHLLQIMDSGVYWIAGVNTVKSGVGFMWQGIPSTDYRSQLTLRIANLNLLYMASQTTSGKITIMSMN